MEISMDNQIELIKALFYATPPSTFLSLKIQFAYQIMEIQSGEFVSEGDEHLWNLIPLSSTPDSTGINLK